MQEQREQPVSAPQEEATENAPRQPWQRPALQHLHVSLDTAQSPGSAGDGKGAATTP